MTELVVIVCFAPLGHAGAIREALANAGAGRIGEYSACSFSARGEGRFLPSADATPHIGQPGMPEVVDEVRIECICPRPLARTAVAAMLATHPYEQPAWHCYSVLHLADL